MFEKQFTKAANAVAYLTGLPLTFALCVAVVVAWAASGPIFGFSDTWQLIINTGTTICTFLMVFLLQNTGNRTIEEMQERLRAMERLNRDLLHEIRQERTSVPAMREAA